eukprot:jgi/Ulvmu1/1067/UM105_0026.1
MVQRRHCFWVGTPDRCQTIIYLAVATAFFPTAMLAKNLAGVIVKLNSQETPESRRSGAVDSEDQRHGSRHSWCASHACSHACLKACRTRLMILRWWRRERLCIRHNVDQLAASWCGKRNLMHAMTAHVHSLQLVVPLPLLAW